MATNPSNSTTTEAEQLDAVPAEPEAAPQDPSEQPAEQPAGIVIDANGTAWEDTEATRNERAIS